MKTIRLDSPGRKTHGLTLGEMMIVLVVFSLLALMFFLSSSHAMVKSRMSRTVHEQRLLAGALQRYEADYLDLPTQHQGLERLADGQIGYLTQIPFDPFIQPGKEPQHYAYERDLSSDHRWMIISAGPDGKSEVKAALDQIRAGSVSLSGASGRETLMSPDEAHTFIIEHSYDPTNGSISGGDVITTYSE